MEMTTTGFIFDSVDIECMVHGIQISITSLVSLLNSTEIKHYYQNALPSLRFTTWTHKKSPDHLDLHLMNHLNLTMIRFIMNFFSTCIHLQKMNKKSKTNSLMIMERIGGKRGRDTPPGCCLDV